jgi:hypothetical protein
VGLPLLPLVVLEVVERMPVGSIFGNFESASLIGSSSTRRTCTTGQIRSLGSINAERAAAV